MIKKYLKFINESSLFEKKFNLNKQSIEQYFLEFIDLNWNVSIHEIFYYDDRPRFYIYPNKKFKPGFTIILNSGFGVNSDKKEEYLEDVIEQVKEYLQHELDYFVNILQSDPIKPTVRHDIEIMISIWKRDLVYSLNQKEIFDYFDLNYDGVENNNPYFTLSIQELLSKYFPSSFPSSVITEDKINKITKVFENIIEEQDIKYDKIQKNNKSFYRIFIKNEWMERISRHEIHKEKSIDFLFYKFFRKEKLKENFYYGSD